ncbi:MAG: class I SAM-dependent methyltransferase [Kiritimatiellia bacterium]
MQEAEAQRQYWDAISGEYRAITRINVQDFHYGPMIAGESTLKLLPPLTKGMKALELGCGEGQNSRWLARRGVQCVAVDVSEGQLCYARKDAMQEGLAIDFQCCPIEAFDAPDESFDLITSSHAFEFLSDPFAQIQRITHCLKPGGWWILSTVHPVYNGEWVSLDEDDGSEVWGRFLPNYFTPVDDIREQPNGSGDAIVSRAWPVSAWFNGFRKAGVRIERLEEPQGISSPAYESDDWREAFDEVSAIPTTLILVGRKI